MGQLNGEIGRGSLGTWGKWGGGALGNMRVGTWEHPFDSYDKYMARCYNTYF
jgi:hypothetical protein